MLKTASELLLSSAADGTDLRTVDPETQARLEALLEAAGILVSIPVAFKLLDMFLLKLISSYRCFQITLLMYKFQHPLYKYSRSDF